MQSLAVQEFLGFAWGRMNYPISFVLAIVTTFALIESALAVSVTLPDEILEAYSICLSEATENGDVKKDGNSIRFDCFGSSARKFFDLMGSKGLHSANKTVENGASRGEYIIYYTSPEPNDYNQCWHRITDARGYADDAFGCNLYLPGGEFLNR
jgi:hypothetical protein